MYIVHFDHIHFNSCHILPHHSSQLYVLYFFYYYIKQGTIYHYDWLYTYAYGAITLSMVDKDLST